MQVVILAAGEGTRMRPLTERRPKPMLPVAGRPLVEHVVDAAVAAGATEVVLVVGYEGERIRSHFGDAYDDVPVSYAAQSEQRGTADAVAAASDRLDGPFAVLNGDNLYRVGDLDALFDAAPAVACTRVETPSNYGVLSTDGGRVTGVEEKPDDPPSNLANAGAYAFPDAARSHLDVPPSERGERELTDVLDAVTGTHEVSPIRLDGWLDVGRPWELLAANERRLSEAGRSIAGEVHADAELDGAVVVEPGASVGPGTVVEGPVHIQSGASVGPNASVRGATLVGPDASVGHGAAVENSVLMAEATVAHLSSVGDSVLGRDVNLGPGTTIANRRPDERTIRYTVKGRQVSTGRRTFGAVLGDTVQTGINTSVDPGVRLAAGATTAPGERVSRDH